MSLATRSLGLTRDVVRELGMVVPRTVAGLNESTGWAPATPRGRAPVRRSHAGRACAVRVFAAGRDTGQRCGRRVRAPRRPRNYRHWASMAPTPIQNRCGCRRLQRRRIAGLAYERMTFEHDPALPKTLAAEGLGGPARAVVHLCRHRDGPRPWLIWVHGAGQGGTEDLVLSRIGRIHHQLGFNVAMPVQPGHGCRRREWPAYPDMDPLGNVAGMMRAVSEVRAVVRWVRAASQRGCGSGDFDGHPGGRAGFAPGAGDRRGWAVHPDPGAERDDRATPGTLGFVERRIPRVAGIPGGLEADLGDRSAGRRSRAAAASDGSSSVRGTTGWRCASPRPRCRTGGAANCTGMTAATSVTFSRGGCSGLPSDSCATSRSCRAVLPNDPGANAVQLVIEVMSLWYGDPLKRDAEHRCGDVLDGSIDIDIGSDRAVARCRYAGPLRPWPRH